MLLETQSVKPNCLSVDLSVFGLSWLFVCCFELLLVQEAGKRKNTEALRGPMNEGLEANLNARTDVPEDLKNKTGEEITVSVS